MKTNRAFVISVSLNLALLGWVVLQHMGRPGPMTSSTTTNATVTAAAPMTPSSEDHDSSPQLAATPRASSFDWRQVESRDYKDYIANLRGIGCPEKTIKAIIAANVNDLFSARRAAITQTNRYEYWRANPVNLTEDQRRRLQELSVEKGEMLKALGIESSNLADLLADTFAESHRSDMETKELELEFLPETKRQGLKEILFQVAQQELKMGDDHAGLEDLEQQAESAIKSFLTPDEFRNYELRTSVPASQLREALKYLEPTETEFGAIFDSWNVLNAHQPGSAEYREAQRSNEAALKTLLDSQRFELYLKGVKTLGYSQ